MKEQNNVCLLESLEQLSTPQLDAMLQSELQKEQPDKESVQLILKILWKREEDFSVVHSKKIDDAWKKYEKQTRSMSRNFRQPLTKAAAILILCSLFLFALPQEASAASIFDRIAAWSENIFGLFARNDLSATQTDYVFQTNHPGLQELYDTVTGLGVTVPVVPMWLGLEFELIDCIIISTPKTTKIHSIFSNGNLEIILEFNVYSDNTPRRFQKDDPEAVQYERNEILHYIFQNRDSWTIVWTQDNIECFITIDCQEYSIYRIIDSIYTAEE